MRSRIVATCAVIALLAVACGNAGSDKAETPTTPGGTGTVTKNTDLTTNVPVDAPGVTDTEIKVAAVTTNSNNPTGSYAPLVDGVKAYFEMINDGGGIYGRKLVVSSARDDQLGSNRQTVQASLSQDNAFATFIATVFFTGAPLLADANQPVFMWNINKEFNGHPTFFANNSALCFTCAGHIQPYLAQQLGAEAYVARRVVTVDIPESRGQEVAAALARAECLGDRDRVSGCRVQALTSYAFMVDPVFLATDRADLELQQDVDLARLGQQFSRDAHVVGERELGTVEHV
jgi:hypothetical protein